MILIFGALLAVYVFCRAILPLRLKWGWKALLAVLLAVAAFKFHLLHLFGGPMFFSPVLPEGVLLAAAWLFSVLFLFFFLLLAADAARLLYLLVLFCLRKKRTERFRIIGNRVNLVLLAFAAVLGAPTAGCTAMSEENLRAMIAWLDPSRHPLYILLPAKEYLRLRGAWGLP